MKINVIGLGYIGLPTALMMAANGLDVVGTDYNKELVKTLNEGRTTFEEEGLDELFNEAVSKGIKFTTEYDKTERSGAPITADASLKRRTNISFEKTRYAAAAGNEINDTAVNITLHILSK